MRLLSEADVAPLLGDGAALDRAIDAVEASILRSHGGEPGEAVYAGVTLANGDELATFVGALPSGPATVRIFPRSSTGPRTSARLGILLDGRTGELLALIGLGELNSYRTAVPAGVAVRHLAPPGASMLAILGSGLQARAHLRTYARVMPGLRTVRVWSPTEANRLRFAAEMSGPTGAGAGIEVVAAATPEAAVEGADVVAAAGRSPGGSPALADVRCLRPGALFVSMTRSGDNLIDAGAALVVPTSARPELVAAGFSSGFFRDRPVQQRVAAIELADVIATGRAAGGQDSLVFELAAPYLWDIPILQWVHDWAVSTGSGTVASL